MNDQTKANLRALAEAAIKGHFNEACESSRLLGATQYKKANGCYTEDDARFERAMHESIAMHRRALLDENDRLRAEVEAMRKAATEVIEFNRAHANDCYGDANKAESWACVRVLRNAMKEPTK
jgi:hypothetical protein